MAQAEDEICGFACVYANEDATWGTLLDNLHVHKPRKGHGIGTELIKRAARWAFAEKSATRFYLWVLAV